MCEFVSYIHLTPCYRYCKLWNRTFL